jgi:2'-5' RNA ligase
MPFVVGLGVNENEPLIDARRLVGGDETEPYLSLAVFDSASTTELEAGCTSLATELSATRIEVSGVGTFQGETPAIYASVILTEELRLLHAIVHDAFQDLECRPYYVPGSWVPHITVCMCKDNIEAESVFSRVLPLSIRGSYSASTLLLVSSPPVSIVRRYDLPNRS